MGLRSFILKLFGGVPAESMPYAPASVAVSRSTDDDKAAILDFLENSAETTDYQFRSTEAIAKGTGIAVATVRALAGTIPGVRRNRGTKEIWTLA